MEDEVEELNLTDEQAGDEENDDRGDVVAQEEESEGAPVQEDEAVGEVEDGSKDKIPKARLNEVIEQRRAAEELAAQLKAENEALKSQIGGKKPAPEKEPEKPFDFDAKEEEAAAALISGDTATYRALRAEIRAAERLEASRAAEEAITTRQETTALQAAAAEAVAKYPFLDRENGDDQAKQDVIEWRDFFVSKGKSPSQALRAAVEKVGPIHAVRLGTMEEKKPDQEQRPDPRKAAAVERNVAAAEAQGPDLSKAGIGERATAGRINIAKMNEAEFAALPDSEKKRLRGD